ncbi:hypothetical protein BHM03_00019661 [Ensete ventricosum]|nr:hypothetical protein BHM03_00019661 [Ensete ventricosum]
MVVRHGRRNGRVQEIGPPSAGRSDQRRGKEGEESIHVSLPTVVGAVFIVPLCDPDLTSCAVIRHPASLPLLSGGRGGEPGKGISGRGSETEEKMVPQKTAEEAAIVASGITTLDNETEHGDGDGKEVAGEEESTVVSMKSLLWHGGSAWDAWFSCASNQVLHADRFKYPSRSHRVVVVLASLR